MPKAKQFVTDENGVRVAVVLDIKEYEELLDDLEDLQAVREYEEAKASGEVSWRKASTCSGVGGNPIRS